MQETQVRALGWEDSLEKEMALHSSILAWKIPEATVHGVAKNRTWLSDFISFQGLFTIRACMLSHFSHVPLFAAPWTVSCQAPLSMGFFWQEYWNGLPCPPPGDLPDPRIEPESPASPALQVDSLPLSHREAHPPRTQPEYALNNFKEGAQKCRDLLSGRAGGTGFLLAYFPVNWQWGRKDGLFEDFFFHNRYPNYVP